jgi:heptosyltransferase-1
MRVLLVKMSSMGDVVHTLPAATDLIRALPDVKLDWVVEEGFASIPAMHPAVSEVIPIAMRRWRTSPWRYVGEFREFARRVRTHRYDLIIDAQGLLKSALVTGLARGTSAGFSRGSAREPLASTFYGKSVSVPKGQHAISRVRQLFARSFGYELDESRLEYGLARPGGVTANRILFLHGTTWPSKHWPEAFWKTLARLVSADGFEVLLPHGNDEELARANRIGEATGAKVLQRVGIEALFEEMALSAGIVSVDSGLGHLAAAVEAPLVGLFGPTDPGLTGPIARNQGVIVSDHLPCMPCLKRDCQWPQSEIYPPCFEKSTPEGVWKALRSAIGMAEP